MKTMLTGGPRLPFFTSHLTADQLLCTFVFYEIESWYAAMDNLEHIT